MLNTLDLVNAFCCTDGHQSDSNDVTPAVTLYESTPSQPQQDNADPPVQTADPAEPARSASAPDYILAAEISPYPKTHETGQSHRLMV